MQDLPTWFTPVLLVALIWSSIWKGMALWRAAKKDSLAWFIVFMIVNTLGILEIIYLYVIAPKKKQE